MKNKMSLKVGQSDTEDILKLKTSISSYLSDELFNEKDNDKTYPATIKALKIGWILEEKDESIESDGKKFLKAIGNSENDELFQIVSIKVLIEFLYIKYKKSFLKVGLPSYILQLVIFFLMIWFNEKQFREDSVTICVKDELIRFQEEDKMFTNYTQALEYCYQQNMLEVIQEYRGEIQKEVEIPDDVQNMKYSDKVLKNIDIFYNLPHMDAKKCDLKKDVPGYNPAYVAPESRRRLKGGGGGGSDSGPAKPIQFKSENAKTT